MFNTGWNLLQDKLTLPAQTSVFVDHGELGDGGDDGPGYGEGEVESVPLASPLLE